jgi:hypothetical protein
MNAAPASSFHEGLQPRLAGRFRVVQARRRTNRACCPRRSDALDRECQRVQLALAGVASARNSWRENISNSRDMAFEEARRVVLILPRTAVGIGADNARHQAS